MPDVRPLVGRSSALTAFGADHTLSLLNASAAEKVPGIESGNHDLHLIRLVDRPSPYTVPNDSGSETVAERWPNPVAEFIGSRKLSANCHQQHSNL